MCLSRYWACSLISDITSTSSHLLPYFAYPLESSDTPNNQDSSSLGEKTNIHAFINHKVIIWVSHDVLVIPSVIDQWSSLWGVECHAFHLRLRTIQFHCNLILVSSLIYFSFLIKFMTYDAWNHKTCTCVVLSTGKSISLNGPALLHVLTPPCTKRSLSSLPLSPPNHQYCIPNIV